MSKSKRMKAAIEQIDVEKVYSIEEAIKLAKETSSVKFDAGIEVHIRMGIDPKKGDQVVRGSFMLPHGSGKVRCIAAFVADKDEKAVKEAGADIVGTEDVIKDIKKTEKTDFDVALATPDMMRALAPIAKVLGTKGLMPNPKLGTVTADIAKAVTEFKTGRVNFRNDDGAIIHMLIGRVSFEDAQLVENYNALVDALKSVKPDSTKGVYFSSVSLSSSMGPGIKVSL